MAAFIGGRTEANLRQAFATALSRIGVTSRSRNKPTPRAVIVLLHCFERLPNPGPVRPKRI